MQRVILQKVSNRVHPAICHVRGGIRPNVSVPCIHPRLLTNEPISTCDPKTNFRQFEQIPGPKCLPFVGTLYKYLPFGEYSIWRPHETGMNRYREFGPIVREEILPGSSQVYLYDPNDIATVYGKEGETPTRPPIFGLQVYKEVTGMAEGISTLNGEAWKRFRSSVQRRMAKKTSAVSYIPAQEQVAEELIERMRLLRNSNGEVPNYLNELYKWAMESIGVVCFDSRLGALDMTLSTDSEPNRLIEAVNRVLNGLHITFVLAGWYKKRPNSRLMRRLFEDLDTVIRISDKHIECALKRMADGKEMLVPPEESLLLALLSRPNLTRDEALSLMIDLFIGGIDSTANTLAFNLNNLAGYPECQKRLQEEIDELAPKGTMLNHQILEEMKYLRAVTKETARMTPTTAAIVRVLDEDIVLSGYRIPGGTEIILGNTVICRLSKYFENPNDFRPERWLRKNTDIKDQLTDAQPKRDASQRFSLLPFGHGPRMCIGRRFAEQEVWIGLVKILQNFTVEYHHKPIGQINRLFNKPDRPLRFTFIERNSTQ